MLSKCSCDRERDSVMQLHCASVPLILYMRAMPTSVLCACRRLTDDKPSSISSGGASKAASLQASPHIPILTPLSPKHGQSPSQADRLKMPKLNLQCPAGHSAVQFGPKSQVCNRVEKFLIGPPTTCLQIVLCDCICAVHPRHD